MSLPDASARNGRNPTLVGTGSAFLLGSNSTRETFPLVNSARLVGLATASFYLLVRLPSRCSGPDSTLPRPLRSTTAVQTGRIYSSLLDLARRRTVPGDDLPL